MKITFLGTRSSAPASSKLHQRHSALLVETAGARVMIDCGSDWAGVLEKIKPDALLLTHAHDDHAGGLDAPYPCPVYAGEASWDRLAAGGHPGDLLLKQEQPLFFGELKGSAFPVDHSLRAPAFGLRLSDREQSCVYLPDVAALPRPRDLLQGTDLYIGDGSSFNSSLERMEEGVRCGHATIPRQLIWAVQARIKRVLFTHCGNAVIEDELRAGRMLRGLAGKYGLQAEFAWDGMEVVLQQS